MTESISSELIDAAIRKGLENYFSDVRSRIDPFIKQHFLFPGTWQTNKVAWGWDLLRAPINLLWAPFYIITIFISFIVGKLGFNIIHNILMKVPNGLTTSVQQYISFNIYNDLLKESTTQPSSKDHFPKNSLFFHLNRQVSQIFISKPEDHETSNEKIKEVQSSIRKATIQYANTRTASADISNSLLAIIGGAFIFQKFTPGGLAVGLTLATLITQKISVNNFIFGEYLGGIYYSIFPAEPSNTVIIATSIGIMTLLAIIAPFSGLLTDPIQSWTGLHKKRLEKLVTHLEHQALSSSNSNFNPKDQYVARILDILDAAKSQMG